MRLCFGSYLAVLVSCKAPNVDNKVLCETLLHSVAPNFEFTFKGQENEDRVKEDVSSKLLRCEQNVSPDVITPARSTTPQTVAIYFQDHICSLIDENRRKEIILAIKDVITNDPLVQVNKKTFGIDDDTVVDIVSGTTKRELAAKRDFCFSAFLAGVFLFAVRSTNNRSGKDSIKSVTDEYIQSFADRANEINLIAENNTKKASQIAAASQGIYDTEFAEDVAGIVAERLERITTPSKTDQEMLTTVLAEARGNCLFCGKFLGTPVRGKVPTDNAEIVYLVSADLPEPCYENAVALCKDTCAKETPLMSDDEKADLLEKKRKCADLVEFLAKINGYKFQKEIETVLREIHKAKNDGTLERTDPKDLVEIEQKIVEPYLKDKIDASMVRLYKKVVQICGRLEQEIGFNTKVFGEMMKSAQIVLTTGMANRPDITDPQEYVVRLLVEKLYAQVGQKHADACEIIIGYLVKRCDLFNETAKQS